MLKLLGLLTFCGLCIGWVIGAIKSAVTHGNIVGAIVIASVVLFSAASSFAFCYFLDPDNQN